MRTPSYRVYKEKMRKIADIHYAMAVLQWDEEVYMPEKGAAFRGQQMATLATIAHDLFTDSALGELLEKLAAVGTLNDRQRKNLQRTREDYEKQKKYPSDFVHQLSVTCSECYQKWIEARRENDFSIYKPALQKMVNLKQKEAEIIGYEEHPYDALLDDFEKGTTVRELDKIFGEVQRKLQPLTDTILAQSPVDNSFLHQHFDRDQQWEYSLFVLKSMGYDFKAGRQDISEHPFTTSFNPEDVRVTSRVDEKDFSYLLWSSIHEGGHGLYEQGLPKSQYGLPAGKAASLSIHESQSRLWENNVGRSLSFWEHFYPRLQTTFRPQLANYDVKAFYRGINKVAATPIRTEADELTYHFHILIRFEIEKELIAGNIGVDDLKEAWNDGYKKYLGLDIKDDRQGVLQDIHWCHGGFGYFPTYSLGSFYAAQFFQTAKKTLPGLEQNIARGEFSGLLTWLRQNIHQHGSLLLSEELCQKITGKPLDFECFMRYAKEKYGKIYHL